LALKGLHKIYRYLNDLVNTKQKREFILVICVPYYILYGITVLLHDIGFQVDGVFALFVILWVAFVYLFFYKTRRGISLRKMVEEQ